MKTIKLIRTLQNDTGSFGKLDRFFTVELPWKDNANNVSCIPVGKYRCNWTLSPRLKRCTYEVTGVKGRAGIRIHSGNFPRQFLGCIGLGLSVGVMDGQRGVFSSQTAIRLFESQLNKQSFILELQ